MIWTPSVLKIAYTKVKNSLEYKLDPESNADASLFLLVENAGFEAKTSFLIMSITTK